MGLFDKKAKLRITGGVVVHTSVYVENQVIKEPEPTVVTVKKGDDIQGFKVVNITSDSITIKCDIDQYSCTIRRDDHFVRNEKSKKKFTAKVGESMDLVDILILDASYSISIKLLEII
ncbi:MAG: hypothetical protein K5656_00020 [Lachnospiraceae bacterium]|nr:hypothetical protein [Lachnospiraceae bacterium]